MFVIFTEKWDYADFILVAEQFPVSWHVSRLFHSLLAQP